MEDSRLADSSSIESSHSRLQPLELVYQPGHWETEDLIFDGDQFYQQILADIRSAQHTIDLETYIFESDAVGESIMRALVSAADRGVKVRVLVDGVGSPRWMDWFRRGWRTPRFIARVYRPLPWPFSSFSLLRRPSWKSIFIFFNKVNRRNHRKACLIDGKTAYVGSFNISICHSAHYFGSRAWRDTAVRLTGDGLRELTASFEWAWRRSRQPRWQEQILSARLPRHWQYIMTGLVRLNYLRTLRKHLTADLLRRIRLAKNRVWLTNPYFVPNRSLMRALTQSARRGIDVKILVPRKSDVLLVQYASRELYGRLISEGVRIYEYTPSFLHAKIMIVDDWMTVGSTNLNHRSILHDLEVDAIVRKDLSRELLTQKFQSDLRDSEEIQIQVWNQRTYLQKLAGRIALMLKYWI